MERGYITYIDTFQITFCYFPSMRPFLKRGTLVRSRKLTLEIATIVKLATVYQLTMAAEDETVIPHEK